MALLVLLHHPTFAMRMNHLGLMCMVPVRAFTRSLLQHSPLLPCLALEGRFVSCKRISSDDYHSFDMSRSNSHSTKLEKYLMECFEELKQQTQQSRINITERHRKALLRTLLGKGSWSKADFAQRIKDYKTRKKWEQIEDFMTDNWGDLLDGARVLQERDDIPSPSPFQEGLYKYKEFQHRPEKLFSFMSRGRKYQGKFERLIDDLNKTEWMDVYQSIFQELEELHLWHAFVEDEWERQSKDDDDVTLSSRSRRSLLTMALEQEFPKAVPQPIDGGKVNGIQSEINLMTFLRTHFLDQDYSDSNNSTIQVLAPVYIQNQRKGRNQNKKCPYIIDLPPHFDLTGKTTELDAMVVEILPTDQVRICHVWEAKATLNPITIGDALFKKSQVLEYFVDDRNCRDDNSSHSEPILLQLDGKTYTIVTDGQRPKFGIFGKTLLSPWAGIRQMGNVFGEALLDESLDAVEEALTTGSASVPQDRLRSNLKLLIDLSRKYQAALVVQSELS